MLVKNEQFIALIRKHKADSGRSITAYAELIGRPLGTVKTWIHKGVIKDTYRQKIVDEFPEIFSEEAINDMPSNLVPVPKKSEKVGNMLVLVKTELARIQIQNLTSLLGWFLFEASAEDRNSFRDALEDDWTQFLELTRAMTGETAFEVTKNEGRLDWWKR
jgi:hypothetical protein